VNGLSEEHGRHRFSLSPPKQVRPDAAGPSVHRNDLVGILISKLVEVEALVRSTISDVRAIARGCAAKAYASPRRLEIALGVGIQAEPACESVHLFRMHVTTCGACGRVVIMNVIHRTTARPVRSERSPMRSKR